MKSGVDMGVGMGVGGGGEGSAMRAKGPFLGVGRG